MGRGRGAEVAAALIEADGQARARASGDDGGAARARPLASHDAATLLATHHLPTRAGAVSFFRIYRGAPPARWETGLGMAKTAKGERDEHLTKTLREREEWARKIAKNHEKSHRKPHPCTRRTFRCLLPLACVSRPLYSSCFRASP